VSAPAPARVLERVGFRLEGHFHRDRLVEGEWRNTRVYALLAEEWRRGMRSTPAVRAFASHEWRAYRDLRLRALADSPDAFGSSLAQEEGQPDEHWSARLALGAASGTDLPLVAEVDGDPVGLAWARIDASDRAAASLYQMWVAPDSRGLGAGRMLLDAAIGWARSAGARSLALKVSCGDTPATRLYSRAGFEAVGVPEPLRPGSAILVQPMRLELTSHAASDGADGAAG
jgi:RimJ/RimL family protein N-acetyltransferase